MEHIFDLCNAVALAGICIAFALSGAIWSTMSWMRGEKVTPKSNLNDIETLKLFLAGTLGLTGSIITLFVVLFPGPMKWFEYICTA